MKLVLLLISMVIVAYLTISYMQTPSIQTPNGMAAPEDVMDRTREQTKKIEEDMAKRANAPAPPP